MADWSSCLYERGSGDVATIKCLEPLLANVISAIVSLAGLMLFIMLVIGGYNFLFAGGDQKKLEKARGTLTHAVVGLIIIVLAYLIIMTIYAFTGVKVFDFHVTIVP
jgi:hypothetical protein